jgi:hypothetical protein
LAAPAGRQIFAHGGGDCRLAQDQIAWNRRAIPNI